jgi:cyclohexyl-isocyanide hydratase
MTCPIAKQASKEEAVQMDRRTFMTLTAAAAAAAKSYSGASAAEAPARPGSSMIPVLKPGEPRFKIAMVIFDDMTNQDFVGPHDIFSRVPVADIDVLAKTLDPVRTDARGRVLPDKSLRDAADLYDLLFIGGGGGTTGLMENPEMLDFLRAKAATAQYVTSVCTGALVLGAAGLLDGYRAATHWAAMGVLPLLGAIPTEQRVVTDRNRITGGGVTAGIDFGLTVVAQIWGADYAQLLQLGMEYDPQPPFDAGSPDRAPTHIVAESRKLLASLTQRRLDAARRIQAGRT